MKFGQRFRQIQVHFVVFFPWELYLELPVEEISFSWTIYNLRNSLSVFVCFGNFDYIILFWSFEFRTVKICSKLPKQTKNKNNHGALNYFRSAMYRKPRHSRVGVNPFFLESFKILFHFIIYMTFTKYDI